jgi:hypothetical protein
MDVETLLENNLSLDVKELCERGQFTLSRYVLYLDSASLGY